jgi:hypothetical protein
MIIQIKGVIKLNSNADFLILTLIMPKQQPTWNGELAEEQNTMAQGTYSWEHKGQKASLQIQWEQTKKAWAKTRKRNKEKPSQSKRRTEAREEAGPGETVGDNRSRKERKKRNRNGEKSQDKVSLKQPTPQT